jgi:hypothetical protein
MGEKPHPGESVSRMNEIFKTMAMVLLRREYRNSTKRNMHKRWFNEAPHRHVALDDAIEQGLLFCNMHAESGR